MQLAETTAIAASPSAVFGFFEDMADNYERWHPDHVSFRWVEGDGLAEGSVASFEERIAGKLRQQTMRFTAVDPDRYIEFRPTSRLVRFLMPHLSFTIEAVSGGCSVTQQIHVRTGPIGARLNRREFDAVRTHMAEEGANLKQLLEATDGTDA